MLVATVVALSLVGILNLIFTGHVLPSERQRRFLRSGTERVRGKTVGWAAFSLLLLPHLLRHVLHLAAWGMEVSLVGLGVMAMLLISRYIRRRAYRHR